MNTYRTRMRRKVLPTIKAFFTALMVISFAGNVYYSRIFLEIATSILPLHQNTVTQKIVTATLPSEGKKLTQQFLTPSDHILTKTYAFSPIVLEEFNLVFFVIPKVACSEYKTLFRRMMGFDDLDKKIFTINNTTV